MIRDRVYSCTDIQLLSAGNVLSIPGISNVLKIYCQVAVLTTAGWKLAAGGWPYILRSPVFTLMNVCSILGLYYYTELRGCCST